MRILFIGYVVFIAIMCMTIALAYSHEGHGYKHADGLIGPAIEARYCSDGSQIWTIDKDGDGKGDACQRLIYTHNKLHVKDVPMIEGECGCWEETE